MREKSSVQKLPQNISNIVPSINMQKLPPDKQIVPIKLDIKLSLENGQYVLIRDRFNWDLSDQYTWPITYCKKLISYLKKVEGPLSAQDEQEAANYAE